MGKKEEIYIDTITGEKLDKTTLGNGDVYYYNSKNQYHRTDGPAVIRNIRDGRKFWYQNGKRHRLDGPAVEWSNGSKSWCINGKEYTEMEFNIYIRNEKLKNL